MRNGYGFGFSAFCMCCNGAWRSSGTRQRTGFPVASFRIMMCKNEEGRLVTLIDLILQPQPHAALGATWNSFIYIYIKMNETVVSKHSKKIKKTYTLLS